MELRVSFHGKRIDSGCLHGRNTVFDFDLISCSNILRDFKNLKGTWHVPSSWERFLGS